MLIDQSYFVGPLTIAQLGEKSVRDSLQTFIDRWEPIIMEAALGYDFYHAFLDGLDVTSDEVIEQRWLDLLNGVVYTDLSQIKRKWVGFAGGDNTLSTIAVQRNDLHIYGGITPGFPIDGYSFTNANLAAWNYEVEIFGAGTLEREVDWNYKSGGGFSLTDTGYKVSYNEHWVLHFTGKKVVTVVSGGQNLVSPLAGFIYYEYMRNLFRQVTGIGTVKSEGENSNLASPHQLMADAFNDAVKQIYNLWDLLWKDQTLQTPVYPEFDYRQVSDSYSGFNLNYYFNQGGYSFNYMNPLF